MDIETRTRLMDSLFTEEVLTYSELWDEPTGMDE